MVGKIQSAVFPNFVRKIDEPIENKEFEHQEDAPHFSNNDYLENAPFHQKFLDAVFFMCANRSPPRRVDRFA